MIISAVMVIGAEAESPLTRTESPVGKAQRLGSTPPAVVAAALVCPALYLAYILHYSTNALQFDDWSLSPFIDAALRGHFSWGQLWAQHGEPRLPLDRLFALLFAELDHLDVRAMIVTGALLLISSYWLALALFHRYSGKVSIGVTLVAGAIWLSIGAAQPALWAFEVGWYAVTFGIVAMLAALIVPHRHRHVWLVIAIVAAAVASLGTIQGFVAWPIGFVSIVWLRRPERTREAMVCGRARRR